MVQDFRLLWLALLLSVGVGTMGHSASFDCDKAATEVEIAICSDPELSALDQLAHELSKNVKLKIDYDQIESNYETAHENISEHIISSISKIRFTTHGAGFEEFYLFYLEKFNNEAIW